MERLPIWQAAEAIRTQLDGVGRVVLAAPTGSGKTTQVPQMLASWWPVGRILVVEPRRLAARMMARRVAEEMGVGVGRGVGFTTRYEKNSSPQDRIEFVTDGIFLQRLAADAQLPGVAAVVLDEFHERRLAVDLSLSLVLRLQRSRPEVKLVVMSATADTDRIAAYADAPSIRVSGRTFPVETEYWSPGSRAIWDAAAETVSRMWGSSGGGDILVFMPGAYEISRTLEKLGRMGLSGGPRLLALSARSAPEEQDALFRQERQRRVIVATNVAETSVTLPWVTAVVDSGQARVLRFDARRGIERLRVEAISQASATQRAGRAGRVGPGLCVRLWGEAEQRGRPEFETPEVLRADLTEWILRLASMGLEVQELAWLDSPEEAAIRHGRMVLGELGALGAQGQLTQLGRLVGLGHVHPRICRCLLAAGEADAERVAGWCAVLAEDIGWRLTPVELATRLGLPEGNDLDVLWQAAGRGGGDVPDGGRISRTAQELLSWRKAALSAWRSGAEGKSPEAVLLGCFDAESAMVTGFPDRVGVARSSGAERVSWSGGRTARIHKGSTCRQAGPLLALDVEEREGARSDEANQERWIRLALPVDVEILRRHYPGWFREETEYVYDVQRDVVERVSRVSFRDVVVESRVDRGGSGAGETLADLIQAGQIHLEKWEEEAEPWIERTRCVAAWFPERQLITYTADDIRLVLLEFCEGATRVSQLRDRSLLAALQGVLSHEDVRFIERMAPLRLDLPSGHKMRLRYSTQEPPTGRARIQDLYGVEQTPRVAGGRVPVRVEILAPSNRPVQVTEDLAGFWTGLYPEIKKALSRRYPRHEWR